MSLFRTALALLAAVVVASAFGQLTPGLGRVVDPFLIVVVYCGLRGGETHGMLTGMVAGWIQDVQFAGSVLGISALTKLLVGFTVGWAGTRFFLVGLGARTIVLLAAAAADALLFEWLAAVFDIRAIGMSPVGLLWRATVNAGLGVALIELADRRVPREGHAS
jgi:rod shape-determining protein MreD